MKTNYASSTDGTHWEVEPNPDYEDLPYCQCDLEWTEEEEAFNVCSCCGKPINV